MATTTLSELVAISSKQHGLMTHDQVTNAGLSRTALSRLVRKGAWQVVRPRVFRKAATLQTESQRVKAVCLSLGEETTVASHRSAGRLLGLDLEEGDIEVTSTKFRGELPGVVIHRSRAMGDEDRRELRGIHLTTGARTLIDLASCLEEEQLAMVVEEAWRKKVAAPDWVARRLNALTKKGRKTGALAEILADCRSREKPLESALEVRVWRLFRAHDLPTPLPSFEFRDDYGQPGRIDFAFPDQSLAIECDGYASHGEREAFENDRLRTQRLVALGWRVLPVTWRQLDGQKSKVVERIRKALRYRTSVPA